MARVRIAAPWLGNLAPRLDHLLRTGRLKRALDSKSVYCVIEFGYHRSMTNWGVWCVAFAVSLGVARHASAAPTGPVKLDFNSAQELTDNGWGEFANGVSSFTGTAMEISPPHFDEWALEYQQDHAPVWWAYVNPERGWWVEARIKIEAQSGSQGEGQSLSVHDGYRNVSLQLGIDHVTLVSHTETTYAFDTHDFHVYRLQRPSPEIAQLVIDGKQVLTVSTPELDRNRAWGIVIGSIETNTGAVWDYVSYDTAAPGTESRDDDQDGIPLDRDLCPAVEDDGKDTDFDRIGDACDPCVNDALNDVDADGLCADKDICPKNASNPDANANGACDDDECVAGMPTGFEFAPAGAEGAQICQVGALQCLCYNRAQANCSPKSTCAAGCDCRFAGVSGAGGASGAAFAGGTSTAAGTGGVAGNGDPSTAGQAHQGGAAGTPGSAAPAAGAGAATAVAGANANSAGASSTPLATSEDAPVPSLHTPESACALGRRQRSSDNSTVLGCLLGLLSLGRWRRRRAMSARG